MNYVSMLLCAIPCALFGQEDALPLFVTEFRTELVQVPVTVRESPYANRDLAIGDFVILEDGIPQEIAFFEKAGQVHIGFVLDKTHSMRPAIALAKKAAIGILESLNRDDRAFLVTFGGRPPRLEIPLTGDKQKVAAKVGTLRAGGGYSQVWDALEIGLKQLAPIQGKKALIVISDADDQTSRLKFGKLLDLAKREDVPLYFVGLNVQTLTTRRFIQNLAEATSGKVTVTDSPEALKAILEEIAGELQRQYLLGYYTTQPEQKKGFRTIEVLLKTERPYLLEYRKGYQQ